ncbi:MAG: hypothetical protein QXD60_01075 [Nanopusillaceae archaeon]
MGITKEKKMKQLDLTHRTVNLNKYIDELLDIVSEHMMMTESELIRYILTKELEKMVRKIKKNEKGKEKKDGEKQDTGTKRKRAGRN